MKDILAVMRGVDLEGPFLKRDNHYLSRDGDNPEAEWPGYGWPLGSVCWWYRIRVDECGEVATGLTPQSAFDRAMFIICRIKNQLRQMSASYPVSRET